MNTMNTLRYYLIAVGTTLVALTLAIAIARSAFAAEKKEARVTQVVRDVRVLSSHAAPRPAVLNDQVREGNAVRTGSDSRAELTFIDQTLARLGANTVFSFGGMRTYDLGSGAILMYVPKSSGEVKINTSVMTAAVTGFTAMLDAGPYKKLIMLEGDGTVSLRKYPGESKHLHGGQLISIPPGATKLPPVWDFDVCKLINDGLLITGFPKKLPSWPIILDICQRQHAEPPSSELIDPTRQDILDQSSAARPPISVPTPRATAPPSL